MTRSVFTREYALFTRWLIHARLAAHLTQAKLAANLKRGQAFVSKYERGERRLDVIEFMQICTALDLNYCTLLKAIHKGRAPKKNETKRVSLHR